MTITSSSFSRRIFGLFAIASLSGFLGLNLFAQTSDRIGVCNIASESKPIEVESDGPTIAYATLSEAFYAINQAIHKGEINIEVCFDSVEREPAILNGARMASANFSKLTIRPLKDDLTISSKTGFNALIALNGTDNVTIDGDNPNTPGENRNLTLLGWGGRSIVAVQTSHYLIQNSTSMYDGAENNTLKNLNIYGVANPSYGVAIGGQNPGSSGDSNHHNAIINCAFRRVHTGIFSSGKSPEFPNIGTIITKNDLSATGDDRVRLVGIQLEYETRATITENRIGGLEAGHGEMQDAIGIRLGGGKLASLAENCRPSSSCYRSVSHSLVARNIISGIVGGERQSVAGIYIYGYTNAVNTIQNNVITGVTGSGRAPNIIAGIFVAGYNDSKTFVYNNSVSMTGERGSVEIHNPSYAIVLWGEDMFVSMFNNIFANTQTTANNPWAKSYAAAFVVKRYRSFRTPFAFAQSNNNIFYSEGANAGFIRLGSLNRREGLDVETLTDWQKLSAHDPDSLQKNPLFVDSLSDLNLRPNSPAINTGLNIESVTDDLSGNERPIKNTEQKPDIGANEWKPGS